MEAGINPKITAQLSLSDVCCRYAALVCGAQERVGTGQAIVHVCVWGGGQQSAGAG